MVIYLDWSYTLIVCVPLSYAFYFWYTLLYGFIYKTFDHLTLWLPFTLWLYNLWTFLFTLLFLVFGPFCFYPKLYLLHVFINMVLLINLCPIVLIFRWTILLRPLIIN